MADPKDATPDYGVTLLNVGIELNYLTPAQKETAVARREELKRGGIKLTHGQTLLERKYLTTTQLRQLMAEVEYRHSLAPVKPRNADFHQRQIGNYDIQEVISDKGRARVLKARDMLMNRMVALKVLPLALKNDPQWSERFRREISIAGKLNHPNIVTVYGAGELAGSPLMIMEFMDGISLGEKLEREGNLPEIVAWKIAKEVAKALEYAFEHGVIHRDIKPDNILVSNEGLVKIGDLGFSKSVDDDLTLTAAGTTVGTPFYISPEQAQGAKEIDNRTDIYALGCTIYHMLTGSPPFLAESMSDIMLMHTKSERPDPRSMLPEISEASSKLVIKMMSINPNQRPDTAALLVREIDALLPQLPEAVNVQRPLPRIEQSQSIKSATQRLQPVTNRSGRPVTTIQTVPAKVQTPEVPKPKAVWWTRFVDWLSNLFG